MSDLFEAISDIVGLPVRRPLLPAQQGNVLGMPVARPFLTAAVPSDEAAALGDGDWTPEDAA